MTALTLPVTPSRAVLDEVRARFDAKVDRSPGHGPAGECHVWTAAKDSGGYGHIRVLGRVEKAHRVAWLLMIGHWPPPGMLVTHAPVQCHTRSCVNPDHLRLGSPSSNMKDRLTDGTNPFASRTHCPKGHPYDDDNTRMSKGKRYCRACTEARKLDEDWMQKIREYKREYQKDPANRARSNERMRTYKPLWRARRRAEGKVPS